MIFVNKMDVMGADFYKVIDQVRDRLQANPVAVQLPIGAEETFRGIIDLITMKAEIYDEDALGTKFSVEDIPEDMQDQAEEWREKMLEAVAETDEDLMMKFLDGEEITEKEIKETIRKETIENRMVPVLCGSAYKNKGVQMLLDGIVDYMPAPIDIPAMARCALSGMVRYTLST